jgi:release factor glutamine methyltransferase
MLTIREAIVEASRELKPFSESPRLDAELLMAYCLKKNRTYLYSHDEELLQESQLRFWTQLIEKRKACWPIAYLTGEKEFWSLSLKVSIDVLIPRPATETLIEYLLENYDADTTLSVVDLGTGTGAIAIALAKERPLWNITAVDIHPGTLAMAQYNARRLHCDHIQFRCSNWFQKLSHLNFDLIISNPPYIAPLDPHLNQGDIQYEPKRALVSDKAGFKDLAELIHQSLLHLRPKGRIILEHGYEQQAEVQKMMQAQGFEVEIYSDHEGLPRFCVGIILENS